MKKTTIILLFLSFFCAQAQMDKKTFNNSFIDANRMLEEGLYDQSARKFKTLLLNDSMNSNVNYKIAKCYMMSEDDKRKALPYLRIASKNINKNYDRYFPREKGAPKEAIFLFGKALYYDAKFDSAKVELEKFQKIEKKNHDYQKDASYMLSVINKASEMQANPIQVNVTNVGKGVNTRFPEYSPLVSFDESMIVFFTNRRLNEEDFEESDVSSLYKLNRKDAYYAFKKTKRDWGKSKKINIDSLNINSLLSVEGNNVFEKQLTFFGTYKGKEGVYQINCKRKTWEEPTLIIDLSTFGEVNSITLNDQKDLVVIEKGEEISSFDNIPKGGKGGTDLYFSELNDNQWTGLKLLATNINTTYNEKYPYFTPDNHLVFSSNGYVTMGGYDLYYTKFLGDTLWEEPTQFQYPLNSIDDDLYFQIQRDGKLAYISSNRPLIEHRGSSDIYEVRLNTPIFKANNNSIKFEVIDTTFSGEQEAYVIFNNEKSYFNPSTGLSTFTNVSCENNSFEVFMGDSMAFDSTLVLNCENNFHLNVPLMLNIKEEIKDTSLIFATFNFGFNKFKADEQEEWKSFIEKVKERYVNNGEIKIVVESSSSKVPTSKIGGNSKLAEKRANYNLENLINYIESQSDDDENIEYKKALSFVKGPQFEKGAPINETDWIPYQYVQFSIR